MRVFLAVVEALLAAFFAYFLVGFAVMFIFPGATMYHASVIGMVLMLPLGIAWTWRRHRREAARVDEAPHQTPDEWLPRK